jgi:hypothetical protein
MPNSETDRDPFAFAGYEGDGDARVLALFHDWLDASREADRFTEDDADDDDAAFDAALDRRDEIEEEIIATPGGPAALAVKMYLSVRVDAASWTPELAMLRCPKLLDGGPDLIVSMLRDAVRLVPELADLAAPIIHEDALLIDAEIHIKWARSMLAEPVNPRFAEVWGDEWPEREAQNLRNLNDTLATAMDRVAKTEAKTERGRAIKAALGFVA